jgi:hypothetical protein
MFCNRKSGPVILVCSLAMAMEKLGGFYSSFVESLEFVYHRDLSVSKKANG